MKIRNMVHCAMIAALLAVCAWLAVPVGNAAITMQTFGVFLSLFLFGGQKTAAAILVYLLLGGVGLPVFSGFRGGLGVLLGPTGGYVWGFLAMSLVYWVSERVWKKPVLSCILGLLVCYAVGTVWYAFAYMAEGGLFAILLQCVVPYLLPDAVKLLLAWILCRRLKRHI